ncbi:pre-peptidase C-terminal domain-containing protein [Anabaena azotica]|uniref:Pre-peptidase C-terminal domain-containing protein n=1 Tax=Anabaena azotica FACHB-119 TaxID=947527 RepID=A0ABR8CZ58_9NOST|nr:pre-peptidase C-terminal domain-containing protein [Anabaena azotica]MBD2500230.1 pre-peptidase C-terminal domain-containing protein [Anabaena azotica FACHB-119]
MATFSGFTDPGGNTTSALNTANFISGGFLTTTGDTFQDSVSNSDFVDLYQFTLSSSQASSIVELSLDGLTSNADLRLLNSSGNAIRSSSQAGTTSEFIRANLAAGTYYVQVRSVSGAAFTNYNLTLKAEPIQESGRLDNTRATAFDISSTVNSSNSYNTTDFVGSTGFTVDYDDFYRFTPTQNGVITINLSNLTANADLQLQNSFGSPLQTSAASGNAPESISYTVTAGTLYNVRVYAAASSFTNYNFNVSFLPDPVDNAGNTLSASRDIGSLSSTAAAYTDFVSGSDDKDYYKFNLSNNALVNITLTPDTANADLQILNSSGVAIQGSFQSGVTPDTIIRSLTAGTYYILVTPGLGAATNYSLSASATPIGPDQAPNTYLNGFDLGSLTSSRSISDFVGNIDTNDFYKFTLSDDAKFNLTLTGLTDNADLQLLNSNGASIQTSANAGTSNESISVTSLTAGTYYIRVYTTGLANTFYNLNLTATFPWQLLDINQGIGSSDPQNLTNWDGTLYFTANNGSSGKQIWSSNGSTFTQITNLNPTGFNPNNLTVFNNQLIFTADDSINGTELWAYNGTSTQRISNINPNAGSSNPSNLTVVGNNLFFTADNGSNGRELWVYDGTNVSLVKDLNLGIASSNPANLTAFGGKLFFTAYNPTVGNELWFSDGTASGTQAININSGGFSSFPGSLTVAGSTLYFTADNGTGANAIWKYTTTDGASLVKTILPASVNNFAPVNLTAVGSTLYFVTDGDGDFQQELWKSDGTSLGTQRVVSDNTQAPNIGIGPLYLAAVDNTLYFTTPAVGTGLELWKSDGQQANTGLVKDIWAGSTPNDSFPTSLVNFNGTLYFVASTSNNKREVWKSDGTEAGTVRVSNINATNSANPSQLTVVGTKLFFTATNASNGTELYVIS